MSMERVCPWNTMPMPTEHHADVHGIQRQHPWNTMAMLMNIMAMPTEHNADAQGTHRQFPTAPDS